MRHTLAIDYGARFIGIALVQHPEPRRNRVLYAATVVIEAKPLNALVETRAAVRRLRRTRKTHRQRLRRLSQALAGIPNADQILRFCRRRGYSYDEPDDTDGAERSFHIPREVFFDALRQEVERHIDPEHRARVLGACARHLNESRRPTAELRPARFDNRGPSRCNWPGCTRHVPRAENDFAGRLRQALTSWLTPVFAESADRDRLRRSIDHWVRELDGLARRLRKAADAEQRKLVDKRVKVVYRNLLNRVRREATNPIAEKFCEDWKEHYRKAVSAIVRGTQGGRVRFCRQHSDESVSYRLAGKAVPIREDIAEGDLVSRKQQIVFRRLWRLVESRILPLAGGHIVRVVVERVAFDILAGPLKVRQETSPDRAAEMYWSGPQAGFPDRLTMLKEEFGTRCAYCGTLDASEQVEHLLPRSAFPFDSYFNILPSCTACNHRKGARTALEAGLTIHEDAYNAYGEYVRKRKPSHFYHTIKKGLLNLLRRPATAGEAERRLGMLANDLVTVTATQRAPRPLARYLATQLEARTGQRPTIGFCAGRHTALYRSVLLADYDKEADKEAGDLRNHAVDAIVLGCDLPSATALENKNWKVGSQGIHTWYESVRAAAPETLLGLPRVEAVEFVPFFEEDLGGGYCRIDLSAFNWNRDRKATHQLDPFGVTGDGRPLKRVPASTVLQAIVEEPTRAKQLDLIAHRGLRQALQADPEHAAETLVGWLQQTVKQGVLQGEMGRHPADLARRQMLERFIEAPVERVVSGEEPIPPTVGIRCLNTGSVNKLGVHRAGRDGVVFQHYQAQPVIREYRVGYRLRDGQLDRTRPVLFVLNQGYQLLQQRAGGRHPVDGSADSVLHGRPQGASEELGTFLSRWQEAFAGLCKREGIVQVFCITQGCVVVKADGTRFQMRNFDKGGLWMRPAAFRDIERIERSPLHALAKCPPVSNEPAPATSRKS
jgi:5-methylcytosine-specific restriction endonuclease McrA